MGKISDLNLYRRIALKLWEELPDRDYVTVETYYAVDVLLGKDYYHEWLAIDPGKTPKFTVSDEDRHILEMLDGPHFHAIKKMLEVKHAE